MAPVKKQLPPGKTPAPAAPAQDRLITVPQAASQLGVSVWHVVNLIEQGAIKAINIGLGGARKHYRLPGSEIAEFKKRRAISL